uniref:Craniofacial development protein 1 n=1 Tax=Parascaris univalens TaxID=6257 RepID=A0A914ZQT5_PARUN
GQHSKRKVAFMICGKNGIFESCRFATVRTRTRGT